MLFGAGTLPATNAYYPGDPISATFSEALDCSLPYVFTASLALGNLLGNVLTGQSLTMYCQANTIAFDISPSAGVSVC